MANTRRERANVRNPNLDARHVAIAALTVMFYVCLSVISFVAMTYVDRKAYSENPPHILSMD